MLPPLLCTWAAAKLVRKEAPAEAGFFPLQPGQLGLGGLGGWRVRDRRVRRWGICPDKSLDKQTRGFR